MLGHPNFFDCQQHLSHSQIWRDYFSLSLVYDDYIFAQDIGWNTLFFFFHRILSVVCAHDLYFVYYKDACEHFGLSSTQKFMVTLWIFQHMALHQMPPTSIVVWFKPSSPNVWNISLKWFMRFLSRSTCGKHHVLIWRNNAKSTGTTISKWCLLHWTIRFTYGTIASLLGKSNPQIRINKKLLY